MPDWLSPTSPLLPRILQDAGYATGHFGKWHLSNNMIPDSPLPGEYGYDAYGAYNCAGEQMPVHEDALHAIAFIEQSHRAGKPFFINLWLHEPHTPFHTQPKYRWRFRDLDEADNIYASVLSHADDRIGQVLDALDRLQLAGDTLVIFSSDNGPARSAGHAELALMHATATATGAGYGIGAAKGTTGGRKGYKPDGMSQLAALEGGREAMRQKPLFWKMQASWPPRAAAPDHWVSYAVADQQWKLVSNKDASHVELYDLIADPHETADLKDQNPEVVQSLLEKIESWKATLPTDPDPSCCSVERSG